MRKMFSKKQIIDVVNGGISSGQIIVGGEPSLNDFQCITDEDNATLTIICPKGVYPVYLELMELHNDMGNVKIGTIFDNSGVAQASIYDDGTHTLTINEFAINNDGQAYFVFDFDNDIYEYKVVTAIYNKMLY